MYTERKKYKVKPNKILLQNLPRYWEMFNKINNESFRKIYSIEKLIQKETGMEGIEFIYCDNDCAGIGNVERTMRLIPRE